MAGVEDASTAAAAAAFAPARVALFKPPSSPARRRLSSSFSHPSTPAASRPPLAWISLQGRLVGAEEATSAAAIGGGLTGEAAAAWELFSPLQRVLVVAVAAVAARESKRSRTISQLQRSVDLRDKLLENMQQKLEDLCEQMNTEKELSISCVDKVSSEAEDTGVALCRCGGQLPQPNSECGISPLYTGNPLNKLKDVDQLDSGKDEVFISFPHDERRMSDLSDLFSSSDSSVDIQLNSLAMEQDFYNLRKEIEEKDVTINELTNAAHATKVADSKRITELEDMIRRKNMVITRLKKDMVVLEQKVMQLTRERRSSVSSDMSATCLPVMANNLLYDMSSTGSSSSDPDSPVKVNKSHSQGSVSEDNSGPEGISDAVTNQKQPQDESLSSMDRSNLRIKKQRFDSPDYLIHRADTYLTLRQKKSTSAGELKRNKRQTQQESKSAAAARRRWA